MKYRGPAFVLLRDDATGEVFRFYGDNAPNEGGLFQWASSGAPRRPGITPRSARRVRMARRTGRDTRGRHF